MPTPPRLAESPGARNPDVVSERTVEVELPLEADAPARTRLLLQTEFRHLGPALAAASVVVSELVTNAVLYGAPPLRFKATATFTGLHISVGDGRTEVGPRREGSRGLRIVDALATQWGVTQTDSGKYFWAELHAT